MREYQKIPGPYRRHVDGPLRNTLIEGVWSSLELEYLAHTQWRWTEKVDGTNVRIHWSGHKVTFGGRTDNAQLPASLFEALTKLFPEELFEQQFSSEPVTLYGEGYGAGIQRGGVYSADKRFVLFDVLVTDWWLLRPNVLDIADALGLEVVPERLIGSISAAISLVRQGLSSAWNAQHQVEGLVGVTTAGLLDRSGRRLIVKVKSKDFPGETL